MDFVYPKKTGKCLATLKKSIKHTFHKAEYADKMQFYKIKSF